MAADLVGSAGGTPRVKPGRGIGDAARRLLPALLGLVAAAASGCTAPPAHLDAVPAAAVPAGGAAVAVIDRGWHTDIALPADAVAGPVAGVAQEFPGARFLVFGFGDREFYMSREESVLQTVAAMFPGPGVILVTGLGAPPAAAFGADRVVTLRLSCRELDTMTAFLRRALASRADGSPQRLGDGPYRGSLFYASSETYDLFHDCNRWTLAALLSAGLPADPDGVIFAGEVMAQVRQIAARQQRLQSSPAPGCAGIGRSGGG